MGQHDDEPKAASREDPEGALARRIAALATALERLARELDLPDPLRTGADTLREVEAALGGKGLDRLERAAFAGDPDGLLVIDDGGACVEANPAAGEVLGLAPTELAGRLLAEFVDDPALDLTGGWRRVLEAGRSRGTFRGRRADGRACMLDLTVADVGDRRHLVVLRDVTERSRTEAALRENEHLLHLVLDTIPIGVWLVDRHGVITYGNPAAQRIWGGARYVGIEQYDAYRSWRLPGGEPVGRDRATARAVLKGVSTFAEPLEIERFDGVRRVILASALPVRDEQKRIVGAIETNEDVTEQRRLEQQFLQSQKMEAVGRLAGGVAHDFNNLLSVILGRGALLQAELSEGSPTRRNVDEILAASERAAALTRQLLAFGRRQLLQRRPLDVNDVVEGLRPMLSRMIGEDVELRTELAPGLRPVLADVNQLEQVLMNLAVNARDAMPEGGALAIATRAVHLDEEAARGIPGARHGSYVELAVADEGSGMDSQTLAHLFEPFFTTKGPGKGTGLGLATVYGIVEQCDGHISVESRPGEGSTFRVRLPVTRAKAEPEATAPQRARTLTGSETLLLVEDEEALRDLVREGLETLGYRVLAAANGAEALEIDEATSGTIDLVVTDVIMPRMHGRDLVRRLRQRRKDLAVVFMSGYAADVIEGQAILDPEWHYIAKPFSAKALAEKVREALDARDGASEEPPTRPA